MYVIHTENYKKNFNIGVWELKRLIKIGTKKCELNWELWVDNWRKDH